MRRQPPQDSFFRSSSRWRCLQNERRRSTPHGCCSPLQARSRWRLRLCCSRLARMLLRQNRLEHPFLDPRLTRVLPGRSSWVLPAVRCCAWLTEPGYPALVGSDLRLLGASFPASAVKVHYMALQRLNGRVRQAAFVVAAFGLIEIAFAIVGATFGWSFGRDPGLGSCDGA